MSRSYEMSVEITGIDAARREQVIAACCEEWSFSPEDFNNGTPSEGDERDLTAFADGALCGGETEEKFVDRFARAVWKANAGHCQVIVHATYTEALPYDTHVRDEADFQAWSGSAHLSS